MSRLIKSTQWRSLTKTAVPIKVAPVFSRNNSDDSKDYVTNTLQEIHKKVEEAERQANDILKHAHKEKENAYKYLEQQKNNWLQEKEELKKLAFEQGRNDGYELGKAEGRELYQQIIEEANNTILLAKKEYNAKLNSTEETMLALSIKVAEKILGRKLDDEPTLFLDVVKNAIKEVKEKVEIKIFVHPSKYPLLIENKHVLQTLTNNNQDLLIFMDSDLTEGACWIDSSAGRLDASIDTQLTEIKEKILQLSLER
ncbi:MAG: flagellar assembly protein FliH [Bacillaceae bacterium]|nr:flagellar assembly protein FliH [Bacillaceae bacterium]